MPLIIIANQKELAYASVMISPLKFKAWRSLLYVKFIVQRL